MIDGLTDVRSVRPKGVAFNPTWHLTRRERRGCHRCVPCAGSLSLGRYAEKTPASSHGAQRLKVSLPVLRLRDTITRSASLCPSGSDTHPGVSQSALSTLPLSRAARLCCWFSSFIVCFVSVGSSNHH